MELSQITQLVDFAQVPAEPKTVLTKEISAIVAYLIGFRNDAMEQQYADAQGWKELKNEPDANVIRYLSIFRTATMRYYNKIDYELRYNMKNLQDQDFFNKEDIQNAEKLGLSILQYNFTADKYLAYFCRLINENIDKCRRFFPEWVSFDYIRDLFLFTKYNKPDSLKSERARYSEHFQKYPYHMYIHWKPEDAGFILLNDKKFLTVLYRQHGENFTDMSKLRDASDTTKNNIYGFIDGSEKVAIAVDCENVDPFKLYSALKNLDAEEMEKIEKLTLYDDANTTVAWDFMARYLHLPVEHIEVERVVNNKSLVDMKMAVSVSRDFFQNGITSFILISSDSDFWGLISSMPEAEFLVMYEYEKCGSAIREALENNGIYNCSLDDFGSNKAGELKRLVLFDELEKHLPELWGVNAMDLTRKLYENTKITGTQKEMETFCEKYVKTLKLQLNAEGNFEIVIRR